MQTKSIAIFNQITLKKESELPRTLSRCVCPQKNERQQGKPVIDSIRNKKNQEV